MNTYIGARYVPIFGRKDEDTIQWDNTKPYEPLTIVLYQGNSYTSRQAVPIGIDILNEEFWALTGNYNAQVEQYRTEVASFNDRITANADAISAETLARQNADDTLQDNLDEAVNGLEQSIQTLGGNLSTETHNRENADTQLSDLIDTESQARVEADNGLRDDITALSDRITNLGGDLGTETQARIDGDSALQTQINALSEKSSVIMVEDYGAVGDGTTDCTTAVQNAIAENPNSIIAFKGGTYVISDTIYAWGNLGGCLINFGGANIVWTGAEKSAFTICKATDITEGHYLYPYIATQNPRESRCIFNGGTFVNCFIVVAVEAFHSIVSNVKIVGARKYGVVVGQDTATHGSLQAMIYNVLIMKASADTYWSEEATALGTQLEASSAGIICYDPDNQFNTINVNRYPNGVIIRSGGQVFTNCHFTTQYKEARSVMAETCAVNMHIYSSTTIYSNKFIGCYFDNVKYIVYAPNSTRQYVEISNSFYFNSGRQIVSSVDSYDAFVCNPNMHYVSVSQLTVVPADGRCRLFDATIVQTVNFQMQSLNNQEQSYVDTIYSNVDAAYCPYVAAYTTDGELTNVLHTGNTLNEGQNACIGCIVLPGNVISRFCQVELTVVDRNYLSYHGFIRGTGTSISLTDDYVAGSSRGRYSIYVGEGVEHTLLGTTFTVFPVYIHANQNLSSTPVYVALDSKNSFMQCFLNKGALPLSYPSSSYVIQKSFTS